MMASATETGNTDQQLEIFCDPCQTESENVIAESYCEECNEYLCKHCSKVHRRLAATKDHKVKYQNDLPEKSVSKSVVSKFYTQEKCFVHEGHVIDHCCISHEELCCMVCLSKRHQNCKDILNIAECLSEFDVQKEENEVDCKMQDLTDELDNAMYLVQTSLKAIEHNHDEAYSKMLKAKTDAFEHIEEIYETLRKHLSKIREGDLDRILHYKEKCDTVAFDMKALESYLRDKKKSSKIQLILALKSAGVKIKSNRHELKEIKFNKHLNVSRYRFQPDSGVTNMKTQPSRFGDINVLQNVIKSASRVASLKARDKDDASTCCVTGMTVLSTTLLVVVDRKNASVKLIDTEQDNILSKVTFESAPWDMTVISDKEIAVTVPDNKTVDFLSVSECMKLDKMQEREIKLEGKCYGITNCANAVIVIVSYEGKPSKLEKYGLGGTLLQAVETDVQNPQYIVMNPRKTKIYISDNGNSRYITERSATEFMKLDTLNLCRCNVTAMTMDKTGVLYYCNRQGNYSAEVDSVYIDEKQGIDRPRVTLFSSLSPYPNSLAFCNETNRLFVGKDGDEIEVYVVL